MSILRKIYPILLILLFSPCLHAQFHPSCDGQRYAQVVFDQVTVTKGIKFGEGTTIGGNFQELYMDVYEPFNDNADTRPVVILAFGGSFIGGEREDLDWLCEEYARRGYVAVTIDYRLYDLLLIPLPTEIEITEVVIKSISDMRAAIRHLRQDAATANIFKIDPELIFVGGISAGSITASHTAFLDSSDILSPEISALIDANGGFEGNTSDNYQYSSEVQGLVNYSGGLAEASWVDSDDPSFISFHDDNDQIVPYSDGFASIFGFDIIFMYGSKACSDQADDVGLYNELNTIEDSEGHVSYFFSGDDELSEEVISKSSIFLYEIICGPFVSDTKETDFSDLEIYPNPVNDILHINYNNGKGLDIYVYDALGRKILSKTSANLVDLSPLKSALYYIELIDAENFKRTVRKLVKTN